MQGNLGINSSVISSANYENGRLTIDFSNGKSIVYKGVPEAKAKGLKRANSAGGYYNRNIRGAFKHA